MESRLRRQILKDQKKKKKKLSLFDELYFNISVVSDDLEMCCDWCCDWSTSFAFRFSRRSCGRNAWWTPKNVCAGCYRLMRNVVCGAFRIRLYYLKRKGVKWAQRGPLVCQSNVDQSPTWIMIFIYYLYPLHTNHLYPTELWW